MGRVHPLAALLLAAAVAAAQEAPVPNLVANGSFEQLTDAGQATGWEVKPSAADAVAIDNVQCYAGHQSLRVRQTAGVSTIQQDCRPPAARHLLVCWVKREGPAAVRGQAVGPAGQVLAEAAALPDVPDWQVLQATFNPGEVGQVTIRLTVDGPGTAWLDEILLVAAEHAARVLPAERPATGRNLALHKPYSYSPAPGYDLCTDPDDVVQLTDGVYTKGHFWSQKSTVGWLRQNPQVTIDLGRVEAIDGMAISVAGGGWAGVMFPVEFRFYVSDDDACRRLGDEKADLNQVKWTHILKCAMEKKEYWADFKLDKPVKAKYIRIELVRNHGTPPDLPWTETSELKIYPPK